MSAIVYVNGAYVPAAEAKISVFDRGFLFADGIYEVSAVFGGELCDNEAHLDRLFDLLQVQDLLKQGGGGDISSSSPTGSPASRGHTPAVVLYLALCGRRIGAECGRSIHLRKFQAQALKQPFNSSIWHRTQAKEHVLGSVSINR